MSGRTAPSPDGESIVDTAADSSAILSLRLRILSVALLPLLLAVWLFAAYFAHRAISDAELVLQSRGQESAQRLAQGIAADLASGDLQAVMRLMDLERASLHAQTIALCDERQWTLLSGEAGSLPALPCPELAPLTRKGPVFYFAQPVTTASDAAIATDPKAYVVVILPRDSVELVRSQVGLAATGMALVCLALALALAWHLSGAVSRPLQEITHAVTRLAQGDLVSHVPADAVGELGELQQGINRLAERLGENQRIQEQRIQEATAELRTQKAQAESATLAKSRFLAAASHDLRQPLHALSLLVEALEERVPEGEPKRLAEHISASAGAMEKLLNALLDLSRLDAGIVVARPECFPLNRALESISAQFTPLARMQGLRLSVRATRLWIYSDPALLERILANLVTNALRYTTTGGIVVGARRVQQDWVRLEVWDTGKGIPDEFQARVFEEYFQLANPERHRDKGLGLGLAIVARLARLLGSHVQVRSRMEHGSCFHLRFARCHASPAETAPAQPKRMALPLEHALVAFIDDDASILEAMVEVFDHWGVALAVGEDGEQVRRELEELGRKPDIILSDYRLRDGQTGIEAIAILQRAFGPVPAALITGDTATDTIQEILQSGLPVLHKPLKPAKLRAFLAHLLAVSPGAQNP